MTPAFGAPAPERPHPADAPRACPACLSDDLRRAAPQPGVSPRPWGCAECGEWFPEPVRRLWVLSEREGYGRWHLAEQTGETFYGPEARAECGFRVAPDRHRGRTTARAPNEALSDVARPTCPACHDPHE